MSWNICSISGNPTEDPVISKKTGHLYERRLISKYIESTGECPITHQSMTLEDIIPLQVNKTVKPRPINATSIPSLITVFQNEWDAMMLETFSLKSHLETVRQELSHALYQHDAACRVIARLIRERDEARNLLAQKGVEGNGGEVNNKEEKGGFQKIMNTINEKAVELNTMRKNRKKNAESFFGNFPTQEALANYHVKTSIPLHSTTKPGILTLAIHPEDNNYILTGGSDGHALLYDNSDSKIITSFSKHHKKINDAIFVPNTSNLSAMTASDDHLAYFFDVNTETKETKVHYTVTHKKEVVALALHPLNYLVFAASKDKTFSFHDLENQSCVMINEEFAKSDFNLSALKIHPDGHIMAFGTTSGVVKLWNITENALAESLESHKGEVDSLVFSENGYYFATGSTQQGVVNVWDLRKLTILQTLLQNDADHFKFSCMEFDGSGQYLAVGSVGGTIKMFNTKTWESFTKFESHKDAITSIRFGNNDQFLASTSLDRHLITYTR